MRGITTAATIWSAAAVGMATGLSLYLTAVLGAVFIFIVLEARPFTRRLDERLQRMTSRFREADNSDEPDDFDTGR